MARSACLGRSRSVRSRERRCLGGRGTVAWLASLGVAMALRILVAVAGGLLYLGVLWSVLASLVVPRSHRSVLVHVVDRVVAAVYGLLTRPLGDWERHDRVLASQGAVEIAGLLLVWVVLVLLAFSALLAPVVPGPGAAVSEAAQALFTLGVKGGAPGWAVAVDAVAAFTGLVVVALQIAYLPTLYNAYNRRETQVTLLAAAAGLPPWGPEILARTRIGVVRSDLAPLYAEWERWAADVAESHSTYPVLLRFRSPQPYSSWLVGLVAVLDSAAMHLALDPSSAPMEARLCLRMGFTCLRELARAVGIDVDPDPRPDAPVELRFEEFTAGVERLAEVGFPMERAAPDAWPDFCGWRVNYEAAALALAWRLDVVPAPWTGARRRRLPEVPTRRVVNRTPAHPDGAAPDRSPGSGSTRDDGLQ